MVRSSQWHLHRVEKKFAFRKLPGAPVMNAIQDILTIFQSWFN
jgi:hypothetical protein